MIPNLIVTCKCSWKSELIADAEHQLVSDFWRQAEVVADRHESADVRRAYRHDTQILEVR